MDCCCWPNCGVCGLGATVFTAGGVKDAAAGFSVEPPKRLSGGDSDVDPRGGADASEKAGLVVPNALEGGFAGGGDGCCG